jgi:hypothetical protein
MIQDTIATQGMADFGSVAILFNQSINKVAVEELGSSHGSSERHDCGIVEELAIDTPWSSWKHNDLDSLSEDIERCSLLQKICLYPWPASWHCMSCV